MSVKKYATSLQLQNVNITAVQPQVLLYWNKKT